MVESVPLPGPNSVKVVGRNAEVFIISFGSSYTFLFFNTMGQNLSFGIITGNSTILNHFCLVSGVYMRIKRKMRIFSDLEEE